MQDETPQEQAVPQIETAEVTGDATRSETVEERCAGGVVADVALIVSAVVPLIPVAKDIWDDHQAQKPQPPEIILPPGAEEK